MIKWISPLALILGVHVAFFRIMVVQKGSSNFKWHKFCIQTLIEVNFPFLEIYLSVEQCYGVWCLSGKGLPANECQFMPQTSSKRFMSLANKNGHVSLFLQFLHFQSIDMGDK